MQSPPSSTRRKRLMRSAMLVGAVAAVVAASLGVAHVVRAGFEPAPKVLPYDPLPRW